MQGITPFLWFDTQAVEAAEFYIGIFPDSRIISVKQMPEGAPDPPPGGVIVVDFELGGRHFQAMNAGPMFKFNESISFAIHCENQQEVDHYWDSLLDGGEASACGWLRDRYGLSWQVTPLVLLEMMADPDKAKAARVTQQMLKMVKLDIEPLVAAYEGR